MNNFNQLKRIEINGETILPIVLYGPNRAPEVTEWNKKVMVDYLGIPVNYLPAPFPQISHGACMNYVIANTIDNPTLRPDYYFWLDNDAVLMRHGVIERMYEFVKDKETIYGQAWQSNHKKGPTGLIPHAYASQACLIYSSDLYDKLGRPDMDHNVPRSDTAEELTYEAKLRGYTVSLIYPSSSVVADTPLDNGCHYGLGNVYGNNFSYHVSQQNNPRSAGLFIEKCREIIAGEFEIKK